VAARLGESDIPYSRFEDYVKRTVGDSGELLESGVLSQLFDQFLEEELLVRLAADRGLVKASTAGLQTPPRPAIDALLQDEGRRGPGPAEVARYYRAHRAEFQRPERVKLRQILTEDRRTADKAFRELSGGADFAALARQISRDPSAASGGYQGELSRADLPPAFVDLIFSLKPGEVSRVVPADYGFHIFQVTERLPAEVAPLEQVRSEVVERLRQESADRRLAGLVEQAKSRYPVFVYERNLPFHYQGTYSGNQKTRKT
jgi:parvulin-like peptidyl-prolyl isomerase